MNLRSSSREKPRVGPQDPTATGIIPRDETTSAMVTRHLSMETSDLQREVTQDMFPSSTVGIFQDESSPSDARPNPTRATSNIMSPLDEITSSSDAQIHRNLTNATQNPSLPQTIPRSTVLSQMADHFRTVLRENNAETSTTIPLLSDKSLYPYPSVSRQPLKRYISLKI